MDIQGKVAIITGGASGIGAGLAERFAADGARGIVVADLQLALAEQVAARINADGTQRAMAVRCDVSTEADIQAMVAATRARFGQVDIYISNAGIGGGTGGFEVADEIWERMWKIHGMAHVWAARAVVPEMVARGEGGFVVTASAAGLLNIVETAPYGVTKHASVAFAEWLRIGYGRRGVRVSCLCPQGVATAMTAGGAGSAEVDGMLQPSQVAECVVQALRDETFLILPHPEVLDYLRGKTANYDKWLGGMQKLYGKAVLGEGKA
jgi:NAD(P)-dependent dehydrogenase (short-subunit alcohol dehydrogenase family)